MSKKKLLIICIIVSIGIALIATSLCISFFNRDTNKSNTHGMIDGIDKGILDVLEQNLLEEVICDEIDNLSFVVCKGFCDGVRIYIQIETTMDRSSIDSIVIVSNSIEYQPDFVINMNDYSDNYNESDWLLVYNCINYNDLEKLNIVYNTIESINIIVPAYHAKEVNIVEFFEEIDLQRIIFGRTSTLITCNIIANIEGDSFQIVIDDAVVPVYVIAKEKMNYVLLVPTQIDETTAFTIISNNEHGVEMRVPVNLSSISFEGID